MNHNNCMDETNSNSEMSPPGKSSEPGPTPDLAEIDIARGFSMHMKQKLKNQPGQSCGLESPAISDNINFEIRKTNAFSGKDSKNLNQIDFSPTPYDTDIFRGTDPHNGHSSPDIQQQTYENNPNMTPSYTGTSQSHCIPSPNTLLLHNERQPPFSLNTYLNNNNKCIAEARVASSILKSLTKPETVESARLSQPNNPEGAISNTARGLESKDRPAYHSATTGFVPM